MAKKAPKKKDLKNKKDILIRMDAPKFALMLKEGISAYNVVLSSVMKVVQS